MMEIVREMGQLSLANEIGFMLVFYFQLFTVMYGFSPCFFALDGIKLQI